jgi:hypothetical protein
MQREPALHDAMCGRMWTVVVDYQPPLSLDNGGDLNWAGEHYPSSTWLQKTRTWT